jgi:hypothetical protein
MRRTLKSLLVTAAFASAFGLGCGPVEPQGAADPQEGDATGVDTKGLNTCGNYTCGSNFNYCCYNNTVHEYRCTSSSLLCTDPNCAGSFSCRTGGYCLPSTWTECNYLPAP